MYIDVERLYDDEAETVDGLKGGSPSSSSKDRADWTAISVPMK
jgi:hypothetical protein